MGVSSFNPETGRWEPATPLPEPWLWRVWRFLRIGNFK